MNAFKSEIRIPKSKIQKRYLMMRYWLFSCLSIAFATTAAWSQYQDNTPALGSVRPSGLVHILDIEVRGSIAYAGGSGGLWIIDIGRESNPVHLGTFRPGRSFRGSRSGSAQVYGLAVSGNFVFCCERTKGLEVVNVANPASPTSQGQPYRRNGTYAYEHAIANGTHLYLAAHGDGVEIVDISNPQQLQHVGGVKTGNAFALARLGALLFVADGADGLSVVDISQPASPQLIATTKTTGMAIDVVVDEQYAYVAVGSSGMDIFDIRNPTTPTFVANYHVDGFTNHLNVADGRAYLANWETVEVVDISTPAQPKLIATQHAFERAMAIAIRNNTFYVGDWATFRIYDYENTPAPDIHTDPLEISFGTVPVGSRQQLTMQIENLGQEPLSITGISASGAGFSVESAVFTLNPSETRDVGVIYEPAGTGRVSGFINIRSDDPDERQKIVPLVGGDRTIGVGDTPPPFALSDVHGNTYRLQDFIDQKKTVVLALFASW